MTIENQNFEMFIDEYKELIVDLVDENGEPFNVNNFTWTWAVMKSDVSKEPIFVSTDCNNTGILGQLSVVVPKDKTTTLLKRFTTYYHTLTGLDIDDKKSYFFEGSLTIK